MRTLPFTDAKAHLSELVDTVTQMNEVVTITRHGSPAAVLLSVDEFESLTETIAWLQEPGIADDVAAARAEIASGESQPLADVVRERRARPA